MDNELLKEINFTSNYLKIFIMLIYSLALSYLLGKFWNWCKFDQTAIVVLFLQEFAFIAIVFYAVIELLVYEQLKQAGYVSITIAYGMLNCGIYLLVLEMYRVKLVVEAESLEKY